MSTSVFSSWICLSFEHPSWLAQLRPPWVRAPEDPTTPVIPPVTPMTAKFINESRHYTPKDPKFLDENGNPLSDEAYRDPPPLYKKHPPEGGIKGWSSVAGACVPLFVCNKCFMESKYRFLIQFCTIGYAILFLASFWPDVSS